MDSYMHEKLDFLTPEQDWELAGWLKTAQQIELATEPAMRDQVDDLIATAYSDAGLSSPTIVWCESPLAMYLSRSIVLLFEEFFDSQNGCLSDVSMHRDSGSIKHLPGENLRWKIRDDRVSTSESIVRTACSANLWYSLTAIELARTWRAVSIRDLDAVIHHVIWAIGRSLQAISGFEYGNRLSITDTTWQSALCGAEKALGYEIPERYRDFKTLSNHRWPFFYNAMKGFPGDCGFGQHDMRSLAIPAFFMSAVPEVAKKMTVNIEALLGLTRSAGWYLPHANVCWVSDRQKQVVLDAAGRPHRESGPAITFNDGWEIYAWHGIVVEPKIILDPESITVAEIEAQENQEVRRIMIERFGFERYFLIGELSVLDDDPNFGTLLLRRTTIFETERHVMLRVLNSTAEPDGSTKVYLLRVPPNMRTAREAVAWTFALDARDYHPNKET